MSLLDGAEAKQDEVKQDEVKQDKACVTPYTYFDGTPGYCIYDRDGRRVKKGVLGSKTLDDISKKEQVMVREYSPKPE